MVNGVTSVQVNLSTCQLVNLSTCQLVYLFTNSANALTTQLQNMTPEEKLKIEERIVEVLKTVYDPEIPVDIYNLGLIYRIDLHDDGILELDMTLTAPNCPAADFIVEDVRTKLDGITGIKDAKVNLVFEPEWDKDMMTEEAKLELGFM